MRPYSAYTTPFSAYRAVPTMMHQTRYFGSVPKTAYNMRFKREAEAEAEAEPEAEAEADAQYYGNYGQFQRRNYNRYNRYTMSPYQYAYGNLPGGYNHQADCRRHIGRGSWCICCICCNCAFGIDHSFHSIEHQPQLQPQVQPQPQPLPPS